MKASLPFKYITAVKNGKQYVVFDYKDKAGKRKRKWVKTDLPEKCSKKLLNAKVNEIVEEFTKNFGNENGKSDSSPMAQQTVKEYFDMWLTAIKPDIARTTHNGYRNIIRKFTEYLDKEYPDITLGEMNRGIIQDYLTKKFNSGLKGKSIKQYYLGLHSAFTYAVKMEILENHPMDKMTLPRAERYEASFYNQDEINTLFKVFEGDPLELIVHIAAYYGLRRCEILGLRWDAIDFQNKTITIQRKIIQVY